MNNLQFTLEDRPLMLIQSPELIDVSGDSGEEFVVKAGDLPDLENRFKIGGPRSDMMTAIMEAASATLVMTRSKNLI